MRITEKKIWSTEKRRDTVRLLGIAAFNGILTAVTGVQFLLKGSGPLLVEASHDLGDTAVTSARVAALQNGIYEKPWLKTFRKMTYATVSSLAVLATVKSGHEFYQVCKDTLIDGFAWNDIQENLDKVVNGGIIATGNEASFLLSQRLEGENDIVHDAKHHARVDRDTSLLLAAGIAVGAVVPFVAEAAGIATGVYTAIHMRPTEQNLQCHSH